MIPVTVLSRFMFYSHNKQVIVGLMIYVQPTLYLDFYKFAFGSPPGTVDLYSAPLLGCCHPQDAVQEAGGLFRTLLVLQLLLLVELRQEAWGIHYQGWSCTQTREQGYLRHQKTRGDT